MLSMKDLSDHITSPLTPLTADVRRAGLKRMQQLAVLLLLAAVLGFAVSHAMGGQGVWGWIQAFCEAAAIGALADWFAVVALFRRPLGLPIPHTAVIAQNKARIADSLAEFVRDHFLDPSTLTAKLAIYNPAARLSDWLRDPVRMGQWVQQARGWASGTLNAFDDERLQRAVQALVMAKAKQWNAASTTGEVLALLTREGRHLELLDAGLRKVSDYVATDEVKSVVAALLLKHVRKEWPLVSSMVDKIASTADMAGSFAEKLSQSALSELSDVLAQPSHPMRHRYEQWLSLYIARLRDDLALGQAFNDMKNKKLDDPVVQAYVGSLWADIKAMLQRDLEDPSSSVARHLEGILRALGEQIANDAALQASVNEHVLKASGELVSQLRGGITTHISSTLKAWDDEQLVRQLELSVGKDLQFIRISGTLVGGMAGLAIHAVLLWTA